MAELTDKEAIALLVRYHSRDEFGDCGCDWRPDVDDPRDSDLQWGSHIADVILGNLACHCGRPVAYGFDGNPKHHRGLCADCDSVRCDAWPLQCPHAEETS